MPASGHALRTARTLSGGHYVAHGGPACQGGPRPAADYLVVPDGSALPGRKQGAHIAIGTFDYAHLVELWTSCNLLLLHLVRVVNPAAKKNTSGASAFFTASLHRPRVRANGGAR
ncbi:MAG: hypothetical protein CVU60_05330 [Deltaproteobacteria bacterium HGW-Deltaproteobacteria-18]|nr:MAG: hypothetical protein CVU60_05330 [Deltaproteobacteria bacterium HGW-Deltaproteobacteria-18]